MQSNCCLVSYDFFLCCACLIQRQKMKKKKSFKKYWLFFVIVLCVSVVKKSMQMSTNWPLCTPVFPIHIIDWLDQFGGGVLFGVSFFFLQFMQQLKMKQKFYRGQFEANCIDLWASFFLCFRNHSLCVCHITNYFFFVFFLQTNKKDKIL